MFDLHEALAYVVQDEGSDLHVKVPARPMARFNGQLEPLEHYPDRLTPADTERVLREMLAHHPDKMAAFDSENEIDFSYTVDGLARFRVNALRQRGSVSDRGAGEPVHGAHGSGARTAVRDREGGR